MNLTANTRLNMVIGYPLDHTKSPLLHQTVYRLLELDAVLLPKAHVSLKSMIEAIRILSIELTAVTMPYKEEVLSFLDECSPEVTALKAANTVIQRRGKLYGFNTDVDGIAFAFRHVNLKNKKVLVLGAGGAGRAMGYFLKKQHALITWLNRTKAKAILLANEFGHEILESEANITDSFDVIVNTTSVGLYPNQHQSPLSHNIFHAKQIVFDMIYYPAQTTFLKQAEAKQAHIISGLDMFIGQGLKQVELLTGKTFPIHLIEHLRQLLILNQ